MHRKTGGLLKKLTKSLFRDNFFIMFKKGDIIQFITLVKDKYLVTNSCVNNNCIEVLKISDNRKYLIPKEFLNWYRKASSCKKRKYCNHKLTSIFK